VTDDDPLVLDAATLRRARHDLSSPLTIIIGFAEALAAERPVTEAERREFASRIASAAVELRGRLDELLG
jgi:signal transduction histidine kinase